MRRYNNHFLRSVTYAIEGMRIVYREERNFRIQLCVGAVVIFFGLLFSLTAIEWGILILAISFVLCSEMMNSAMERYIDVLKPRVSPYVRIMKDIMAGLVLITSCASASIGLLIFIPKILQKFF